MDDLVKSLERTIKNKNLEIEKLREAIEVLKKDKKDYGMIAAEDALEDLEEKLKQEKNLDEIKFLKEKIEMLQEELKIGE